MSPIILAVLGALVLAFMGGQKDGANQLKLKAADLRDAADALEADMDLTARIYEAARAVGLDPEEEIRSLSESCIYPIAIVKAIEHTLGDQEVLMTLLNGYAHYERCMCAECQVDRLPPEERSNIFVEADAYGNLGPIAHANSCVCDKCRSELGIDAEKALAFLLTQSSSTTSPSDTGMSERSIEYLARWKTTVHLRLN